MIAWDTSALVRAVVSSEPGHEKARSLLERAVPQGGSLLLKPELSGAVARRLADDGRLAASLLRRLEGAWKTFSFVPLDGAQAAQAENLARAHRLRGADAVHLAAAVWLAAELGRRSVRLASAGAEQLRAARALGLRVIEVP